MTTWRTLPEWLKGVEAHAVFLGTARRLSCREVMVGRVVPRPRVVDLPSASVALLPERKCRDHGHGGTRKRGVDACGESKAGDGSMAAGSYGQIERQGRRLGTRVAVGGSCTNDGARKQGWRK